MWRGIIVEQIIEGRVSVMVPDLYRNSVIRDIQCSFNGQVGERVVIADLHPDAKAHDWWVVGRETNVGYPGTAYTHSHPIEEVTGLTEALAGKVDDTEMANYVTDSELTTTLTGYATDTELSDGLATKANTPGTWTTITSSYWTPDTTASRALSVRSTPFGIQLAGRVRLTAEVTLDLVVAALPTAFRPPYPILINVPTMGPGTAYAATKHQFELHTNGNITAREAMTSGSRMSFNETLMY